MIFVTLGMQAVPFPRLLEAVERQIINGVITEPVFAQVGETIYKSDYMKIIESLPMQEYEDYIKAADLVICHAGYGALSIALEAGKKIIAAARRSEYGEHVNDHQFQILEEYERKGYVLALKDFSKLDELLKKVTTFTPIAYIKNNNMLQNLVSNFIDGKKD